MLVDFELNMQYTRINHTYQLRDFVMSQLEPQNNGFQRAVACLIHPFSLIAMGLLLLNDHLFRIFWPSCWTGKLGDFAWLFFFPFALAALLFRLLPRKISKSERWVSGLAFSLTGGVFTLAKIWPPFHTILVRAASGLFGWSVTWRIDPTDLIGLFSLVGAAWMWHLSSRWKQNHKKPSWLVLLLAAFLTVANSAYPPSEGIFCLEEINGQVYAISFRDVYSSDSGGLSWQPSEYRWISCDGHFYDDSVTSTASLTDPILMPDPVNPSVVYRITTGSVIERSSDNGQTWITEFKPVPLPQAVQSHIAKNSLGLTRFKDSPLDAVFDPKSGNLIFAMGFDGVLIRQPDGTYTEVGVGDYQRIEPGFGQMLLTLFPGEALMALVFGGLGLIFLISRNQLSLFPRLVSGGAGLLWVCVALGIPPALGGYGYGDIIVIIALGISGLAVLSVVLYVFIKAGLSSRPLLTRYLLVFLIGGLLFFLPFITWVFNILPNYRLAQVFGIILGLIWFFEQSRRDKRVGRTTL